MGARAASPAANTRSRSPTSSPRSSSRGSLESPLHHRLVGGLVRPGAHDVPTDPFGFYRARAQSVDSFSSLGSRSHSAPRFQRARHSFTASTASSRNKFRSMAELEEAMYAEQQAALSAAKPSSSPSLSTPRRATSAFAMRRAGSVDSHGRVEDRLLAEGELIKARRAMRLAAIERSTEGPRRRISSARVQEMVERFETDTRSRNVRLDHKRREYRQRELREVHTSPAINERSRRMAASVGPLVERIDELRSQREESALELRRHIEEKTRMEATFHPHINSSSRTMTQRDPKTWFAWDEQRRQTIEEARERLRRQNEGDFPFRPELNSKSVQLMNHDERPASDRLYEDARTKAERMSYEAERQAREWEQHNRGRRLQTEAEAAAVAERLYTLGLQQHQSRRDAERQSVLQARALASPRLHTSASAHDLSAASNASGARTPRSARSSATAHTASSAARRSSSASRSTTPRGSSRRGAKRGTPSSSSSAARQRPLVDLLAAAIAPSVRSSLDIRPLDSSRVALLPQPPPGPPPAAATSPRGGEGVNIVSFDPRFEAMFAEMSRLSSSSTHDSP